MAGSTPSIRSRCNVAWMSSRCAGNSAAICACGAASTNARWRRAERRSTRNCGGCVRWCKTAVTFQASTTAFRPTYRLRTTAITRNDCVRFFEAHLGPVPNLLRLCLDHRDERLFQDDFAVDGGTDEALVRFEQQLHRAAQFIERESLGLLRGLENGEGMLHEGVETTVGRQAVFGLIGGALQADLEAAEIVGHRQQLAIDQL